MENEKFELFAIIELFGHQKIAGKVTEQTVGSSTFIRIDVPETKRQKKFTRIVNPTAIYAINPVTEDLMRVTAEDIQYAPINEWDIHGAHQLILESKNNWNQQEDDL